MLAGDEGTDVARRSNIEPKTVIVIIIIIVAGRRRRRRNNRILIIREWIVRSRKDCVLFKERLERFAVLVSDGVENGQRRRRPRHVEKTALGARREGGDPVDRLSHRKREVLALHVLEKPHGFRGGEHGARRFDLLRALMRRK